MSDELKQAISKLFAAVNLDWPHDDCCLKAEGHMSTCNKWKHDVIRRTKAAEDLFYSDAQRVGLVGANEK